MTKKSRILYCTALSGNAQNKSSNFEIHYVDAMDWKDPKEVLRLQLQLHPLTIVETFSFGG
jgi:hypothetical protein